MPLKVTFLLQPSELALPEPHISEPPRLCWKAVNLHDVRSYNQFISTNLGSFHSTFVDELEMCVPNCDHSSHTEKLSFLYNTLTTVISLDAMLCIPQRIVQQRSPFAVPRWNQTVKMKHNLTRGAFLHWRSGGSPKEGCAVAQMKQSRLSFKYALKKCRREQNQKKDSEFAQALIGESPDRFWRLIKRHLGGRITVPSSFGNVVGADCISNMWKDHFHAIFTTLVAAVILQCWPK